MANLRQNALIMPFKEVESATVHLGCERNAFASTKITMNTLYVVKGAATGWAFVAKYQRQP
jgi:hypothetical protein